MITFTYLSDPVFKMLVNTYKLLHAFIKSSNLGSFLVCCSGYIFVKSQKCTYTHFDAVSRLMNTRRQKNANNDHPFPHKLPLEECITYK